MTREPVLVENATDRPADPEVPHIPWPLRLLFILALLILLMASWAEMLRLKAPARPQISAAGPTDHLVVPGDRAGFITLDLPVDEVEKRLGQGRIRPTHDAVLYYFAKEHLTCGVQEGRVQSILVHDPQFQTRTGLGVGSDVEKVIRVFGDVYEYDNLSVPSTPRPSATPTASPSPRVASQRGPEDSYTLHYWDKGVHFNIRSGRVDAVWITPPVGS